MRPPSVVFACLLFFAAMLLLKDFRNPVIPELTREQKEKIEAQEKKNSSFQRLIYLLMMSHHIYQNTENALLTATGVGLAGSIDGWGAIHVLGHDAWLRGIYDEFGVKPRDVPSIWGCEPSPFESKSIGD